MKFPKFIFHLIKSVAVSQTLTCRFSWFSGGLCESTILNFFPSYLHCSAILSHCVHCNIVILRSLHRYGEYWLPCSPSDWRYFGSYVIISKYPMTFCLMSEIIHPRVNNFDIKGKKAWNICFTICLQHQTRSGKIKANKTQKISAKTQVNFS